MEPIRIGLLGCGVVGGAVLRRLGEGAGRLLGVEVVHVAVAHPDKPRSVAPLPPLTTDVVAVAADPDVDVVIEVVGGTGAARRAVEVALESGKRVVTANKALVAEYGQALAVAAAAAGASLRYEAAVGGAVPIIRTVQSLAADRVLALDAVLNGTSNFVLTRMEDGLGLEDALAEARALGFAEADARRDVSGGDSADKLAILAQLTFDPAIRSTNVATRGIEDITPADVARARANGTVIRLVGSVRDDGTLAVRPVVLVDDHPLAGVRGCDNGFVVDAAFAGRLFLSGAGAGGDATATAVLADLSEAVREIAGQPTGAVR